MTEVAIASSSQLAADAGRRLAEEGGNAVDAGIGALLVSTVSEPGVVALGGGCFVTIWPPDGSPVVVDGYGEMPGRGLPPERFGQGGVEVQMEYGGGGTTIVGHSSMATPGTPAALELASQRYGQLPWRLLLEPAYETAKEGFPLSQACYNYLMHAHESIYGWHPPSYAALHDENGRLIEVGGTVHVEHLADSLEAIAHEGARLFYEGELGQMIGEDSEANGGILTRKDLAEYQPLLREPLDVVLGDWHLATNPPPAIGGALLATLLQLMDGRPAARWTAEEVEHFARAQRAVFEYRFDHLDLSEDVERDARRLLDAATVEQLRRRVSPPSTVHTSAVDSSGFACAISCSTGYGSGVIPPGTGIWMNNFLGELELNRRGYHAWAPGTRLPSNMAPSAARRADGAVLSIGTPGADRITTALSQVLVNFVICGMSLEDAGAHPRAQVGYVEGEARLAYEEGLPAAGLSIPQRHYDEPSMYFGGVGAALWDPVKGFAIASDPRRVGGTARGRS